MVVVGEERIKETHFICTHCETGSQQRSYLKDLHPAGTLSLSREETHMFFFFFCSAELTLAVLGSVYEWILSRGESLQVGCHLAAESLSGYSWSPDPRLGLSV